MKPVKLKKLSEIRKKTAFNWKIQRFCSLWYVPKNKNNMIVGLGWLEGGEAITVAGDATGLSEAQPQLFLRLPSCR